ncbi:hypothetical protein BH23VER1_BH23VER1_18910 [soil metagenome]
MDSHPADTPGKRFVSFWLGIAIFFAFAMLALVLYPLVLKPDEGDPTLDSGELAERRLATKEETYRAQTELVTTYDWVDQEKGIVRVPAERAITLAMASLKESTATKTEKVVPGSPTAQRLFEEDQAAKAAAAAEAAANAPERDEESAAGTDPAAPQEPAEPVDEEWLASWMAAGQKVYMGKGICFTCHQPTGMGLPPAFPPLAGTEWATGSDERIALAILKGLQGPIEVSGTLYNSVMPPQEQMLTDEEIAQVITYIRNAWGNEASPVTTEAITYARQKYADKVGVATVADLEAIPADQMLPSGGGQ